jgi:hypothetical protein
MTPKGPKHTDKERNIQTKEIVSKIKGPRFEELKRKEG